MAWTVRNGPTIAPRAASLGLQGTAEGAPHLGAPDAPRRAVSKRRGDYLQNLSEVAASGIVVQDEDGAIIDANAEAERLLGMSRDQMLGATSVDTR